MTNGSAIRACAIDSPRIFSRVKSIAKPVPATHEIVTAINETCAL